MINKELLSVVITYIQRDKKYLIPCLKSLEKSAIFSDIDLEFILVADRKIAIKPKYLHFPVKLITYDNKLSYGQAVNLGMKKAKNNWCIIAAPDVRTEQNTIKILLIHTSLDHVAVISPKIKFFRGGLDYTILPITNFWTILLEQSYLYKIFPSLINHPFGNKNLYQNKREVAAISSTFWLVRRDIFLKIGGFDKRFYLFHDDTDLSQRINRAGYKIIYEPHTQVIHLSHKSYPEGRSSGKIHFSSYFIYLSKYYNKFYVLACLTIILLGNFMRFIYWNTSVKFINEPYLIKKTINKIKFSKEVFNEYFNILNKL